MRKLFHVVFLLAFSLLIVACSSTAPEPEITDIPSIEQEVPVEPENTDEPVKEQEVSFEPEITKEPVKQQEESIEPEITGDPVKGQSVYEDRRRIRCKNCHTLDGNDEYYPSMLGISERAGERVPGLSAAEYIEQSILDPSAYVVEGYKDKMTVYQLVDPEEIESLQPDMITDEELCDLIAFLLTQ